MGRIRVPRITIQFAMNSINTEFILSNNKPEQGRGVSGFQKRSEGGR